VRRRRSASRLDRLAYVIKVTSMALEGLGVPKYSSEYSKKVYDDHSKIGLLVLKQYLDVSYRELCSMISSMKLWRGRVPDHSTLVKFSLRLDANVMDRVLWAVAHMLCGEGLTAAADSTGFSFSNASRHFVKRLRELDNDTDAADNTRKRFAKASFAVDADTKMILACDCVDSRHADVKRFRFLVDDLVNGEFEIKYVVADKGYDAEYVHVDIRERLKAGSFIPIRKIEPARVEGSRVKTSGFNRARMKFFFDETIYNKRSQVETVNSMIKRKMGDTVNGRTEGSRHKEILFRCIAHNIRRLMDVKQSPR
jgi:transposase